MTLTEFLLARIAEDEAVAQALIDESTWPIDRDLSGPTRDEEYAVLTIGAGRVLAECEAKRRIIEFVRAQHVGSPNTSEWADWLLLVVAAVYADHPDYNPEWRP